MEDSYLDANKLSVFIRKYPLAIILVLLILPSSITVPHVLMTPENPSGEIPFPENISVDSEGFVLIVLDGIGEDYFLNEELMPEINKYREYSATVKIRTGPLTLSATCISEMMTGVPNAPINGLRNFNLGHPGMNDPWLLAANDPRYNVAMVGSYVMGNMYRDFSNIDFVNTFKGHSDYYEGDKDTLEVAADWLNSSDYNVMAVHFSGPDKVGHTWGANSPEYRTKITAVDLQVAELLDLIPSQWSVIITADHGMTDMGTHGSSEEITRDVAAIISGPNIVAKSESSGHQRDLSAIVPVILGLPFPVQLHGRIPLDILDYSDSEKSVIEIWNWNAAYQRQLFFDKENGVDNPDLSQENIDWELIPSDGDFSRDSDILISIFTWIMIGTFSILALGLNRNEIKSNWKIFASFIGVVALFILSHAMLKYSAMIPRAIGGLCAVWLVGWSMSKTNRNDVRTNMEISDRIGQILHKPLIWFGLSCFVGIVFWSPLIAVVGTLFAYSILYSLYCAFSKNEMQSDLPRYWPWIMALLCMTFGSIRLWYSLIPFMFILSGLLIGFIKTKKTSIEKMPIVCMLMLTSYAVFFVHKRIYGVNYILEAVESGWPNSIENILISSILLVLSAIISVTAHFGEIKSEKTVKFSIWLLFGLFVSSIESSYLDLVSIALIFYAFGAAVFIRIKEPESKLVIEYTVAALAMQLLLTWGAWSTFATLLILTCSGKIWGLISDEFRQSTHNYNAKPFIAAAVFPWVIWVLWWTLLGQVNGLQTCFEGICPHPRELDPGSILVRGGYVGFREGPNLYWMIFMISSPIILTSFMLMKNLHKNGLDMYPYILFQALIVLGCISVIGFSPEYPRLVFSLTWNIFFAIFQITLATSVIIMNRYFPVSLEKQNYVS